MSEPQGAPGPRCAGEYLTTYTWDYRSPEEQTPRPRQPSRLRAQSSASPMIPPLPQLVPAPSPFAQRARPNLKKKPVKPRPRGVKVALPQTVWAEGAEHSRALVQVLSGRVDKTTQVRPARFDKATQLHPGQVERSTPPCPVHSPTHSPAQQ